MNLILHGTWHLDAFFVWGESSEPALRRSGRRARIPPHPHAAPWEALRTALGTLAPHRDWTSASPATRAALLPSVADAPCLPPWLVMDDVEAAQAQARLLPWKVSGLTLDALSALDLLVALPASSSRSRQWGADLHFWSLVAKLGLELLAQHKYLPGLAENKGHYRGMWLPMLSDPQDGARLQALAQAMPPVCRALFVNCRPLVVH